MAEVSEKVVTREDKIAKAKEFFGRGSRNYSVKEYAEAAEDFSQACELYLEIYGDNADELGLPNLFYAKALIALAQSGENKVLAIQEENEDEAEDDDGPDGNGQNGHSAADSNESGTDSKAESGDPQPGTSSGNGTATGNGDEIVDNDANEAAEEEDDATNLQYAWEALEIAVNIFKRMGEPALPNLADAYFELAEISLENGHCAEAIKDYEHSCEIRLKLEEENLRIIAESKYKVGLCYLQVCKFDESIVALKDSILFLEGEIEAIEGKEQNDKNAAAIKEIEETKREIRNKITEVEEAKLQSVEEVKREIAKIMNPQPQQEADSGAGGSSGSGAGSSSVKEADKPKATDISHLIKRKKPDTVTENVEVFAYT